MDADGLDPAEVEAKSLVDEIRKKHTSVVHEELEVIVNDLLQLTTSELYDVSTHCILELLQNADDNHYTKTRDKPTLAFTYRNRHLQVDSNEDGFEAKHVRAISTVRRSTKSGKNHSFGYTGEKGIGFKSVFRIADRVWISSRQFQFMFDKNQKFGIIAPHWQPFPASYERCMDQTSFLLELSDKYDEKELVNELYGFEPNILLFFRRLTRLILRVFDDDDGEEWVETIVKTTTEVNAELVTVISHEDEFVEMAGTDQSDRATNRYKHEERHVLYHHEVGDMPTESRREGCHTSTLSLAFSINGLPGKPSVGAEQVFALLPVCEHGLKFKLNGDFVLSASRLNIDASLPWNHKLRDGLADAFIHAVKAFTNAEGTMRYIWPFYVPDSSTSSFFQPARDSILKVLADSPLLESAAGQMAKPTELVYVDPKYTFLVDGEPTRRPFTLTSRTSVKYLSTRYPEWAIDSIINLGVSRLTDRAFLEDLKALVEADPKQFQRQTGKWHEELAKTLLPISRDHQLGRLLRGLTIIPLTDGTWASSDKDLNFSSANLRLSKLPSSLSLSLVDSDAADNSSRRLLFQSLGVSEISSARMCRYIVDAHASASFNADQMRRVDLISHATYLFESSWQPPEGVEVDLWFATTGGGRCKGSEVYIRGDYKPNSATARIFEQLRQKYPTIRDNYFLGPVSNDAVKLADMSDCPFVTYQDKQSDSGGRRGGVHLTFDIHDDFFSSRLDNNLKGPYILAENRTSTKTDGGKYSAMLLHPPAPRRRPLSTMPPPLPVIHSNYLESDTIFAKVKAAALCSWAASAGSRYASASHKQPETDVWSLWGSNKSAQRRKDFKTRLHERLSSNSSLRGFGAEEDKSVDSAKTDIFKAWRAYMIKTLHLSEIPRLVRFEDSSCRQKYHLSDEFKFLLQACSPSDVLHLLNEHWTSYAEWLELGATAQKDANAVASNQRLLEEFGSCKVQTRHGIHSLRDTVLPGLDAQLDDLGLPTPVLDMQNSKDRTLRRRLGIFGIKVENDLQYYLTCLQVLQTQQYCPDHAAVCYIYEQIQSRYSSKEDELNKIFEANEYVFLGHRGPKASRCSPWVTIKHCASNKIDVAALYPGCKTLFHGLLGGDGNEIESLVKIAETIKASWLLPDISRLLIKISMELRDATSSRSRLWIRPLRTKAIFPARTTPQLKGPGIYDALVSPEDSTWFIADQAGFDDAFRGIVPLLAFSLVEITKLGPLFQSLGLDSRRLSLASEENTFPVKPLTYSRRDTNFFRSRVLYIKLLIPKSHPLKDPIQQQLENTHVCTALSISHRYTIRSKNVSTPDYQGRVSKRDIAIKPRAGELRIFLRATGIPMWMRNQAPLVDAIASHCGIVAEEARRLLYTALCEPDLRRVEDYFDAAGYEFKRYYPTSTNEQGPAQFYGPGSAKDARFAYYPPGRGEASGSGSAIGFHGQGFTFPMGSRNGMPRHSKFVKTSYSGTSSQWASQSRTRGEPRGSVPPAFGGHEEDYENFEEFGDVSRHPDGLRGGEKTRIATANEGTNKLENAKPDRRLPFSYARGLGDLNPGILADAAQKVAALDLDQHLEYLGECLTSQMFRAWGVDGYDPVLHWTSNLRVRAGLVTTSNPWSSDPNVSPFTFTDPRSSKGITAFLRSLGLAKDNAWVECSPRFHVEVAVSCQEWDSPFVWSLSTLRRIQKRQLEPHIHGTPKSIMLLVHIRDVYSEPRFQIYVDPWDLLVSNRMTIEGTAKSPMVIKPAAGEASRVGHPLEPRPFSSTPNGIYGTSPAYPAVPDGLPNSATSRLLPDVIYGTAATPPSMLLCPPGFYSKLGPKEFRLFILFPGRQRDPLRGAIFTCALGDKTPPFQAVSYEWGPENQGQRYTVKTEAGQLIIREYLHNALRRLRGATSLAVLWIDAICINQADDAEKASQIPLLPRIFQRATCTVALITDENGHGDVAMQTLLQIASKAQFGTDSHDWPDKVPSVPSSWECRSKPRLSDPVWTSVKAFFSSSWFRRVWIIQEIVISPKVNVSCGNWTVEWDFLKLAVDVIQDEPSSSETVATLDPFLALCNLREWESRKYRWNLLSLLGTFGYASSTLARDRFFALLGLASDGNMDAFEPDYHKTSTFASIARRYGRVFVSQGRGIQLLSGAAGIADPPDLFPSWLPDFTKPQSTRLASSGEFGTVFAASKGATAQAISWMDGDVLCVPSYAVDDITHVSYARNLPGPAAWGKYFREIDDMVNLHLPPGHRRRAERLKMQVPVAGATLFGEITLEDSYKAFRVGLENCQFLRNPRKLRRLWPGFGGAPSAVENAEEEEEFVGTGAGGGAVVYQDKMKEYMALLSDGLVGWRFFITKRGYCGIAPGKVQEGDEVHVVGGADVPFVMQKVEGGEGCFRLVGGCFVEGIMGGEALKFEGVRRGVVRVL